MRKPLTLGRALSYVFLTGAGFIVIWPILYMVLGAFTTDERLFEAGLLPLPNKFDFEWIVEIWGFLQRAYLVTLLRVGFYVAISLLVGIIGGYLFSKVRFPGRDQVFLLLLSGMVMPAILMIVPQFIFLARFPLAGGNNWLGQGGHGFVNEWPALFLYGWVPPFAIFLFKQSFDMLPTEYEDAAKIDGAGFFGIIFRVYGPLLSPTIAAMVILTFLAIWNDYLWPSVALSSTSDWAPISYIFGNAGRGGGEMTATPFILNIFLMAMWPPAAAYFLLQRYFVQGLVASGLKG